MPLEGPGEGVYNRRRAAAHALAASLLDAAWTRLPTAMDARWRDSAARGAWAATHLDSRHAAEGPSIRGTMVRSLGSTVAGMVMLTVWVGCGGGGSTLSDAGPLNPCFCVRGPNGELGAMCID